MSDQHSTDKDDSEKPAESGPRREADDTTESDAGLTGDEGVAAQPALPGDEEDD